MDALVSIVLPVYNVEKYLDRCMESVINQTYQHLEILLIDDGATDSCPQKCDVWAQKDRRIRVIHKENAGLGMARNTGIGQASGEYICFFDSDDYVEPDTVEACVAAARENEAELVVFGHSDVTPEGECLQTHVPHPYKPCFSGEEITSTLLPMSLYADQKTGEDWETVLSACNKLYSMAVIRKTGWRFVSEREIISEDFYSLTELHGHLRKVYVLDRVFYHYTVNNASLSRSYKADRFDKIKSFYESMVTLSKRMELEAVLDQPIKAVTFALIIGAMKLAVVSGLSFRQRRGELGRMIKDDFLQSLVRTTDYSGVGMPKKLLYKAIKNRLVLLCYFFVYLRNKRNT